MTRKEKIADILEKLNRVSWCGFRQYRAIYNAVWEIGSPEPNLRYAHNLLAQAWGLPLLKANGRP